ncbi:Ras-related protein RABF2b [Dictyocoela muelleri]|nr:Ras-related protein RABF2b [Dictyocoela muelleri]
MASLLSEKQEQSYKMVILGHYSVGKTSLVLQYVKKCFNPNEESTIGAAFMTKTIMLNNQPIKFEIWDTAGQERYNSLIPMYYRGANVALIVYDITNPESFEVAKKWVHELTTEKPKNFLKVVVGNKVDLEDYRRVSYDDVSRFCRENGMMFFETSAKTGENVEKIFTDIATVLPKDVNKNKQPVITIRSDKKRYQCC